MRAGRVRPEPVGAAAGAVGSPLPEDVDVGYPPSVSLLFEFLLTPTSGSV